MLKFILKIIIVCISIVIGLRSNRFNDYFEYFDWFNSTPSIYNFFQNLNNLPLPFDYLFFFIFSVFKTFNGWYLCLIFIALISLFSKLNAVNKIFNTFFIFIWFVLYFSFIGFQFELVQFRYGLGLGFILLYLINEKFVFYVIAALIHSSLLLLLPAIILHKIIGNKQYSILRYILILILTIICYQSITKSSILNFELILNKLPEDLYFSGKLTNQILKTEESFSLIMTIKLLLFLSLSFYAKNKFEFKILLIQVYLGLIYILTSSFDTVNARISAIIDLIGITLLLYYINKNFDSLTMRFILFVVSIMIVLISYFKFINSPTMLLKY